MMNFIKNYNLVLVVVAVVVVIIISFHVPNIILIGKKVTKQTYSEDRDQRIEHECGRRGEELSIMIHARSRIYIGYIYTFLAFFFNF